MKKQLCLNALLQDRCGWTAEYGRAHADVANNGVPRFQLLFGLSTHMELSYQSETIADDPCAFQAIYKRSSSDKALITHGWRLSVNKMLHIMF